MIPNLYSQPQSRQDPRSKAMATARLLSYVAHDLDDLQLDECKQLLILCATLIRIKFDLPDCELTSL
jgi:hypothetical protein